VPTRPARHRLDEELVDQGLFENAEDARRAIMAGEVFGADRRFENAGEQVRPGIEAHVRGRDGFVGRGALKLEAGLEAFGIDPTGLACLDVGCSTGGFTDCLLRHGAASVLAVDVGYAQFDWRLRIDPRVCLLERTNILDVPTPERAGTIQLAVCDVSFTSVVTVLPAVRALLAEGGTFLTLVKPQFEVAREEVGEGGVVREPSKWLAAIGKVEEALASSGIQPWGLVASPITGHKGNHEFLLAGTLGGERRDLDGQTVVSRL
jgi:23S rRNA (cytidine1920-2'-O)/16S rRNA (cytidine1409-2'-O)-methyltransferase